MMICSGPLALAASALSAGADLSAAAPFERVAIAGARGRTERGGLIPGRPRSDGCWAAGRLSFGKPVKNAPAGVIAPPANRMVALAIAVRARICGLERMAPTPCLLRRDPALPSGPQRTRDLCRSRTKKGSL